MSVVHGVASKSGEHGTSRPASWLESIDPVATVRGASRGFTVLLLGGLVQPIATAYLPVIGVVWLPLTALAAFVVAAWRPGNSAIPWRYGALAAIGAYLLIVPLVLLQPAGRSPVQLGATAAVAFAVGATAGWLRGRRVRDE